MKDLFSIIITHYNQWDYIFNAIDSVVMQNYKSIEIIFTDDASKTFNKEEIKDYLKNYNISISFVVNEKNIGTVHTLHKAIKQCKGEYILFFAADDELNNKFVLSNFVKKFKNKNVNVVSSKCNIYDKDMKNKKFEFPNDNEIEVINSMGAFKQYRKMINGTIVAPGATAFRTKILKQKKYLKSKNKYIEDWELFLKLTLNGQKINVINIYGLNHRGGGISENKNLPIEMKKAYLNDFDNIFKKIIIPNYYRLTKNEIEKNIDYYNIFNNFYDYKSKTIKKRYDSICNLYDLVFNKFYIINIFMSFILTLFSLFVSNKLLNAVLCPLLFLINYKIISMLKNFYSKKHWIETT